MIDTNALNAVASNAYAAAYAAASNYALAHPGAPAIVTPDAQSFQQVFHWIYTIVAAVGSMIVGRVVTALRKSNSPMQAFLSVVGGSTHTATIASVASNPGQTAPVPRVIVPTSVTPVAPALTPDQIQATHDASAALTKAGLAPAVK